MLGASFYRLEKADGGFRFVCSLPYAGDSNRDRHFEALAASEDEAKARGDAEANCLNEADPEVYDEYMAMQSQAP